MTKGDKQKKVEYLKIKKKDIRANYKLNIDLRKLKGSLPL